MRYQKATTNLYLVKGQEAKMINKLIHSHSQLFKLNRKLPKVNYAISQCQGRFKCASRYMGQPFCKQFGRH